MTQTPSFKLARPAGRNPAVLFIQHAIVLFVIGATAMTPSAAVIGTRSLEAGGGNVNFFSNPEMDFKTAIVALVVLIVSGVLASIMPAAKAAAVNPIVALQDE